ncbi:MAG: hypothetical protein KME10_20140 [Plectolyngbya sp. WJT66-NPBG17]|jgi:hypothetical protein|nr:hypothetical protein [Plectolyngbya sp. WJT66-NPBG17]
MVPKKNSSEILLLLLLTDIFMVAIHIVAHFSIGGGSYWSMASERGLGESFQYIKELWLVFSFAVLVRLRSNKSYLSLSLLFCYLLADDLFAIHENVGNAIATMLNFQPMFQLNPIDFGELLVSAIAGIFFIVAVGCSYWFGGKTFQHICKRVLVLVGGLAFCGVVLDALHIIVGGIDGLSLPLEILEDGGEMVFMSGLCWYGISLLRSRDDTRTESTDLSRSQSESLLQR